MHTWRVRDATAGDIATIVAFTLLEAREAEEIDLDEAGVTRGVSAAFHTPPVAQYWVAEADGTVVASISTIKEWSNFRGGYYWWIQSLFIVPEHRGRGLIERLIDHVTRVADEQGALELRLYAHETNGRALAAYRRCGFEDAPYRIMTRRP